MPPQKNLSNRADGMLPGSGMREELARRQGLQAYASLARVTGSGNPINDEKATQAIFQIKLNNIGADDKIIALHAGSLLTVDEIATLIGVTVDAIAKTGVVIVSNVTCTTKANTSLEHFQRYLNLNPTRIIRIKVESNEEDQLSESLVLAKYSPVMKLGSQEVIPSNAKRQSDLQTKLVLLDLPNHQLDDQTVFYTNLLAGRTLTLTLFLGAAINTASNLEQMANAIK